MSPLARWFVVLGMLSILPAALLIGGGLGEMLRDPDLGPAPIVEREGPALALAVISIFLFSTAAGLQHSRRWALLLALGETGLLMLAGMILVLGNSRLMAAVGAPEVASLATIPLGLAAMVLGARLARSLWEASDLALPFGPDDVRALGALGAVAIAGAIGHALVSRLPT